MEIKKWMQYGQSLLVVGIALALVACGSSKNSSSSQILNPGAGIYGPNPNGYYGNMYWQSSTAGYLGDNFAWKNVTITDGSSFQNFLKKVQSVCDQAYSNGGIYSCTNWANAYFRIVYQASSTSPANSRIMFMTYPQQNANYWYGYQLPSMEQFFMGLIGFPIPQPHGAIRNPIALDMTVSMINQNQGFEARAQGALDTLANTSLIQFQVVQGKVLDQKIEFRLSFEGRPFASGSLLRCTHSSCQ